MRRTVKAAPEVLNSDHVASLYFPSLFDLSLSVLVENLRIGRTDGLAHVPMNVLEVVFDRLKAYKLVTAQNLRLFFQEGGRDELVLSGFNSFLDSKVGGFVSSLVLIDAWKGVQQS